MPVKAGQGGPREVVLAGKPAMDLDAAKARLSRLDQVYSGLVWRLAREPEAGVRMPLKALLGVTDHADIRVVRTVGKHDLPILVVTYKFDEDQVVILQLRAFPPGAEPLL